LLLKLSPLVDELALYDVVNTPGVAADLSHISSNAVSANAIVINPSGSHLIMRNRKPLATFLLMTAPRRLSRMPTSSSSPLAFPVRIIGGLRGL